MTEQEVRTWFGERGHPIADNAVITFAVSGEVLFIHNSEDEYDEVESYCLNSLFCEPITGDKNSGFDWSRKALKAKVRSLAEYLQPL